MQHREHFRVKAGSYFAPRIEANPLVVPDQQRAEVLARARRRSESANNKFLFGHAFDLYPGAAPPARLVDGARPFPDQSFQTAAFYFREQTFAVVAEIGREPDGVA